MILRSSPEELDAAGDAGRGGVGGLPISWLELEGLRLTTGNCDATHAHLGWLCWDAARTAAAWTDVLPGGAGAGLGCFGPPPGWSVTSRHVPGRENRLLCCTCLGGNLELLGI